MRAYQSQIPSQTGWSAADCLASGWLRFSAILLLIYALPITLLTTGVIPFEFRFHVLVAMAAVAAVTSFASGHTLAQLGMRLGNWRTSLAWNAGFALVALLALWAIRGIGGLQRFGNIPTPGFYFFYVLISCPCQEFLFRSFLWAELGNLKSRSIVLQLSVLIIPYTLAHLVHADVWSLLIVFMAGAVWSVMYRRIPNLPGVTLSHSLAGAVTIAFGLI